MKRRTFLAGVLAVASLPRSLAAQTAPKVVRIGWLTAQQASSLTPYLEALRAALAELGYAEGRNLAIEFRFGDDEIERVPALAAELVQLPVDLIVAQGAGRVPGAQACPADSRRVQHERRSCLGGLRRQSRAATRQHDRRNAHGDGAQRQAPGPAPGYRASGAPCGGRRQSRAS